MDFLIYEKYTRVKMDYLINNIYRLKELVNASRLHIRVPRILGFNKIENIEKSVEWIKNILEVEPEAFDYIVENAKF